MDGFDSFIGNTKRLKTMYWKVLNYMFVSPFIAKIRFEANKYYYDLRTFPIYLLITGASDAGKTAFVRFARRMMFVQKEDEPDVLAQKAFSPTPMTNLKEHIRGYPVVIDELSSQGHWKYAPEVTKFDRFLLDEENTTHPCFVLMANQLPPIKPEIKKRVMVINPEARLNSDKARRQSVVIEEIMASIGNEIYREYLKAMFPLVKQLLQDMSEHKIEGDILDIWKLSTTVLSQIIRKYDDTLTLPILTWEDYTGEKVNSEKAIDSLVKEYKQHSDGFSIDEIHNRLIVDLSCHDSKEGDRLATLLYHELPVQCECEKNGQVVYMNLKTAQQCTRCKFQQAKMLNVVSKKKRKTAPKIGLINLIRKV